MSFQRHDYRSQSPQKYGKPAITYPYGDTRFPRIVEVRTAKKGTDGAQLLPFLTPHRDQKSYPGAVLIEQTADCGDDTDKNISETYEVLPGPIFVEITGYRDTGIPMLVARQKVAATAAFTEGELAPAAINVEAIADNGDGTCTVTLAAEHDLPPRAWVKFTGTNSTPTLGQQTSGALVAGAFYTIGTYVAGDNFTNVGASSNASGVSFTATGTTPTNYSHGSLLTQALRIVTVPADNQVTVAIPSGSLSGGGTAAGAMVAVNRLVRELKPSPNNASVLVKLDTMVGVPDVSIYNENIKCWKDYEFPDYLVGINFYNDLAKTDTFPAVFNYQISWGGGAALPMQDGYHGPCRAQRQRYFFVGPPPDSFEEALSPTVIMPCSGTYVIEGGSEAGNFNLSTGSITISHSNSFRTGRIPHCLNGGFPVVTSFGAGQASISVDMPPSVPPRFNAGDTITLMGQPSKYDAGALWEVIVWIITVPYTSGVAVNGFSYAVNPAIYTMSVTITDNNPTLLTGSPSSFAVSPTLPGGLSLNSSDGVISGTPTAAVARTLYTVTCSVGGVTQTAYLDLTVNL